MSRDYEAEAVEALDGTQRHTGLGIYEGDPPNYERAQALATLALMREVRRVADAMERKPKPLDVALTEQAELVLKDLLAYPGLRLHVGNLLAWRADSCLAELRRWKEQQP